MSLHTMTLPDLERVLDWAAAEGWNPGLDDAPAFLATDPLGYFLWEHEGEPVAAISVVNHDDRHAFLGLYICRPEWRGRGFGLQLWTEALKHAGDRTIGLDGVADQQANYAKSGFVATGSTIRLEGPASPRDAANIAPIQTVDMSAILALDRAANGLTREGFLTAWLTETPHRRTLVARHGDEIVGFAAIRACRDFHKIGPVVAPDTGTALDLVDAASTAVAAAQVVIDVPAQNVGLIAALTARGFRETFRTARMYRGTPPVTQGGLQAIGTMELS